MRTVTGWIQRKLGLKVNMTKTHITRPMKLKYLGFGFYKDSKAKEWKCRPHQDSVAKFKRKLKELTCRKMPGTVTGKIAKINQVTRGWINYYALGSMKTVMAEAMESAKETTVGIAEVRCKQRPCPTHIVLW